MKNAQKVNDETFLTEDITQEQYIKDWLKQIDEALYSLNRAIDPEPSYPSDVCLKLIQARDLVWNVIQTLDSTRKD